MALHGPAGIHCPYFELLARFPGDKVKRKPCSYAQCAPVMTVKKPNGLSCCRAYEPLPIAHHHTGFSGLCCVHRPHSITSAHAGVAGGGGHVRRDERRAAHAQRVRRAGQVARAYRAGVRRQGRAEFHPQGPTWFLHYM